MKNHILVIETWTRGEYAGFEARELWQSESNPNSWNWKKYNDNSRKYVPPTTGVKLYAQCNLYPASDNGREMYALNVKIDNEMNMRDLEQARADIARLTKIEKKYNELCEKFGTPNTFAQFAAFIAECIGAELAEYSNISGCYVPMSIHEIGWKERKLTGNEQ